MCFLLTMRGRMNFKNIRNEQPPMGQDVLLYSEELEYPFIFENLVQYTADISTLFVKDVPNEHF